MASVKTRSEQCNVCEAYCHYRAFSDLFGKFLVPMILGKNCVILGNIQQIWEKIVQFLAKVGKLTF